MNFFKRALTSITRRKLKSLIFALIVLILGNIMLSSLLIVQSVDGTKDAILRELPPVVSLDINHERLREIFESQSEPGGIEIDFITFDDLERIEAASGTYIKSFDYSSMASFSTKSLEPYSGENEDYMFFGGDTPYFEVMGVANPNFTLLEIGDAKIAEGRTFTQEEIEKGSPVLIMTQQLAEANDYVVGETISIDNLVVDYTESGEEVVIETMSTDFQLVGIIEYTELPQTGNQGDMMRDDWEATMRNNRLITSNNFVAAHNQEMMETMRPIIEERSGQRMDSLYEYNPLSGVQFTYILNSSEEVDRFVGAAASALDNDFYRFATQEDSFKDVAQPLESMKGILTYAFYITLGSAVVVLALVMFAFMRDRQKEIGIYLALGEKRSRITSQMVVESVAVGLVGATLALISGVFVASFISDMLLSTPQVDPNEVMMFGSRMGNYLATIDYDSVLQNYRVALTPVSIISFYAAVTTTIVLAQLIASIYILRFDPKKIML
ncbi:ABC transporter permease [Dethiobacter alkaliphilus]|uniref:ABC transporter permease n=1 Tax=Dethiobacter alkaliphilus TaxID=427926 RepID=UPI002226A36B|nr:ABC transporter permease [Dethiobacter alkaliphilus]MCW3488537.1 ABC transporter permease [Dethiobacter alkaliphilus]